MSTDKACLNDCSEAERRVTARLIHNPYRLPETLWAEVCRCELAAILRGDIPYFYTTARSDSLYDPAGAVMDAVFSRSPLDEALYRLERLSESELSFELQLQRELLERACRPAGGEYEKKDEPWIAASDEMLLGSLLRSAVTTPSGEPLWFVNHANTRRFCMGTGYYHGLAGMAAVLAAYRAVHPDTPYAPELERRLNGCISQIEAYIADGERQTAIRYPEFNGNRSNGCAGHIEGLMRLYETDPDERYLVLAGRAARLLERYSFENCVDLSYRDGIAGILAVLCRYRSRLDIEEAVLRRYADFLMERKTAAVGAQMLWHPTAKPRPISGLDIGIGGIGLALHRAGRLLGNDAYLRAAEDAFAYEHAAYREDIGWPDMEKSTVSPERYGGYHSGNAGLGFLWLYLGDREMLQKAADAALFAPAPGVYSDRLSDGNLGICDFLLEAGRALQRSELTEKARKMLSSLGGRVRHYQDAAFEPVYEPSLFSGDAGYLYLRLRAEAPEMVRCLLTVGNERSSV